MNNKYKLMLIILMNLASCFLLLYGESYNCRICNKYMSSKTYTGLCSNCSKTTLRIGKAIPETGSKNKSLINTTSRYGIKILKGGKKSIIVAIAGIVIAVGAFLFYHHPVIGVLVILVGLFIIYCCYKADNKKQQCVPDGSGPPSVPLDSETNLSDVPEKHKTRNLNESQSANEQISASTSEQPSCALSNDQYNGTSDINHYENCASSKQPIVSSDTWYYEGYMYCTGKDGRTIDYTAAIECFEKAAAAGNKDAKDALQQLKQIM